MNPITLKIRRKALAVPCCCARRLNLGNVCWWARRDSNPHGRNAQLILSQQRLPFRHKPTAPIINRIGQIVNLSFKNIANGNKSLGKAAYVFKFRNPIQSKGLHTGCPENPTKFRKIGI